MFAMVRRSGATSGSPPSGVPELELDVPSGPRPKATVTHEPEMTLELAVDPRPVVAPAAALPPEPDDPAGDARLLADYGDAPRHWILSPLYAYRVLKRRRDLTAALAGRREEAVRAAALADDALVRLTARIRATVEKTATYAQAIEPLRSAEELLRSKDSVLAAEQEAQRARLAQLDARLSSLEADLSRAQADERAIAAEISAAQGALGREEANLKRAEVALRAAQQRASGDGTRG